MTYSIFISYSHQEAHFANHLLNELEGHGFKVWMDYHSLIPARSWLEEIHRGIEEADVVLLVISKTSVVSEFVRREWQKSIELKKRIILILFEAVKLPVELEHCEWIDFRRSFKKNLNELLKQLKSPIKKKNRPPQKGFKAPLVVWIAFIISLWVSFNSFFAFWTLYLPYFLIPLPYKILKRDFNFFYVQLALVLLPLAHLLSAGVFAELRVERDVSRPLSLIAVVWLLSLPVSFVLSLLLLFLLRSRAMQRWGKQIASQPKFPKRNRLNIEKPRSVSFTIEAAPEDKGYTNNFIKSLEKYNHRYVEDNQQAEITFVFISRYKSFSAYNPETQIVYPVLLQSTKEFDPKLQRIQWIDLRRGLKNLDALAQMLSEPTKILKALGTAPMGSQTVLPPIIQVLVGYLITLGVFTIGSWSISIFQLRFAITPINTIPQILVLLIFLITIFCTVKSIINRTGRMASLRNLILVLIFVIGVSILILITSIIYLNIIIDADDATGSIIFINLYIYFIGLILIGFLSLRYWKDLRGWFPQKDIEKAHNR